MIDLSGLQGTVDPAPDEHERLSGLCTKLNALILAGAETAEIAAVVKTGETDRSRNTLTVSFNNLNSEMLASRLFRRGIRVEHASPCPDRQNPLLMELKAIELPFSQAMGTIRFTLGPEISEDDINAVAAAVNDEVARLKMIGGIGTNSA